MSQRVPEIMSQCVPEIGGYGDDYFSVMPEIGSKGFESSAPIGRSTMFPHIRPSPKALNSKGQGISPDLEHYVPQAHTALANMNDRFQLAELTWKDGQPAVQTLGRPTKRSEARVPNLDTFFSSSSSLGSDDWISNDEYGLASYKRKNRNRIINNECSGSGNDNDDKIEVLAGSLDSLPPIDEDMVFCFNALDMQRAQKDMPQANTCIAPAFMESHSSNNFQYFSSAPESEAMLKPSLQNFISPEISDSISKLGQTQSCLEKTMNPMRAQSSCSIWEERGTTACDNGEEDEVMEGTLASNSLRSLSPTNDTSRLKRKSKSNHQEDSVFQSDDQETEVKEFFRGQNVRDRQFCRPKRSRAADVHNQSERRRRDRINERMKALQRLIPNSSKTDKASMLDEAIEYVKQLQSQLQQMMMLRNQGMGMLPMMVPMNMQQLQMQMSMLASMNQMGFGMGMGMGMNGPLGMGMGMGMRMVDVNSPTINATPTLPSTTSVNAEPPPRHSGLMQSRATPSAATRDFTELSSFDLHNPYLQDFRSQPMNMDKYKSLLVQQRSHTPQQPSSSLRK